MSDERFHTILAVIIGILTAIGAHASGKPWWVDHPLFGDAFDAGLFAGIACRVVLSFCGERA
jgi:hypothetical protein